MVNPQKLIQKGILLDQYLPIIFWKDNTLLFNMIKDKFEIKEIINILYNKNKLKVIIITIDRIQTNEKLEYKQFKNILLSELNMMSKIIDVELFSHMQYLPDKYQNSEYKISKGCWKAENQLVSKYLLNHKLLKFKLDIGSNISDIYLPIFPNDSQDIYELFNIKNYISNIKYIPISQLRSKIWLNCIGGSHKFVKIIDTPHFKYLNDNKKVYQDYVKVDNLHSLEKYDKVINSLDKKYILENINYIIIQVKKTQNNLYEIKNGIHRACIYLKNNINFIRCVCQ